MTPQDREKVLAVQEEAYALGWSAVELWNESPRHDHGGLGQTLSHGDTITEVASDYIAVTGLSGNTLKYYRWSEFLLSTVVAHASEPVTDEKTKSQRHRWNKTSEHNYECTKCPLLKRSSQEGTHWVTEFLHENGSKTTGKTPPCEGDGK